MAALVDAGPLVALLDTKDDAHKLCVESLPGLAGSLFTTWPAFSEAMYLVGPGGWPAEQALWHLDQSGSLVIADLDRQGRERAAALMEKYRDLPMSLADATLVSLAETLEIRQIFTLDADFEIYRYKDRQKFELVPSR